MKDRPTSFEELPLVLTIEEILSYRANIEKSMDGLSSCAPPVLPLRQDRLPVLVPPGPGPDPGYPQVLERLDLRRLAADFYYENNDKKLFDRLVAFRAKVSFGKIKRYDLQEEDFSQIVAIQNALISPDLKFIDASGMTVADIRGVTSPWTAS